jgi:hypothetical protein
MEMVGKFYGHMEYMYYGQLKYFMHKYIVAIWYISPFWYICVKKNLAALVPAADDRNMNDST